MVVMVVADVERSDWETEVGLASPDRKDGFLNVLVCTVAARPRLRPRRTCPTLDTYPLPLPVKTRRGRGRRRRR